jgi:hypothetical protein
MKQESRAGMDILEINRLNREIDLEQLIWRRDSLNLEIAIARRGERQRKRDQAERSKPGNSRRGRVARLAS